MTTEEICDAIGISESTARRLLSSLSDKQLITRFHGGAQSLLLTTETSALQKRMNLNPDIKDDIARRAAQEIKPGMTVVLLGGTTVYMICKYILERHITVITNSLIVYEGLKDAAAVDLILLGGRYNRNEMEVRGALTNINLRMLKADCLFMGATGLDPGAGFLTDDINSVELYRLCIDAAKSTYVLADSTKLDFHGSVITATSEMVNYLITDPAIPCNVIEKFTEKGVRIILSGE